MLEKLYQAEVEAGRLCFDSKQVEILTQFEILKTHLIQPPPSIFARILQLFSNPSPITGIYLWGSVGSGKTHLMDLFFNDLPIVKKLRLHFHRFMELVHEELSSLQGKTDPLKLVAQHFAEQASIICFDEFVVNDIVDAMLLGRLFTFLFEHGVVLVATSNRPPDDLYFNGLQRALFLPAIALIKKNCQVLKLSSTQDYRFRNLKETGVYLWPLNEMSTQKMQHFFNVYATETHLENTPLILDNRPIQTLKQSLNIIWFNFNALCAPPRSQRDYLSIAQKFSIVLISNLKAIAANDEQTACYFIELIDIFYDNHILLILSSEMPITDIYPEGPQSWSFERTLSRLVEMQSEVYLQDCHRALMPVSS